MEAELFLKRIKQKAEQSSFSVRIYEEGTVISVGDGIVRVAGLGEAKLYELIDFENGDSGIVFDLYRDSIGVVLTSGRDGLKSGSKAFKTERIASVNAGEGLLGRVVDAVGRPLDGGPLPGGLIPYPVERTAPALVQRDFVRAPLYTGIKIIDSMFPIGRGQRELLIGDPSTGKTSIAIDAIINQKNSGVIAVYAVIGQKKSRVLKTIEDIKRHGDMSKTVIVVADASDSFGLQYLAPYAATAIAEYFLDRGKDALIVYDDLTKHAEAYRSLSLLLRRPPGREAFPGDIFFIHSRLLERAAKLHERYGGGSITALPIVETQQGRISSYIPTNLISITDGQIYLDAALFSNGMRPAIDVGRSVSRIGGKAQVQAMRAVSERLKIDYSRFLDLEVFTKFGTHLEEETARLIRRGKSLREMLKQPPLHPFSVVDIVLSILTAQAGLLDNVETRDIEKVCAETTEKIKQALPDIIEVINNTGKISERELDSIKAYLNSQGLPK